MQSDFVYETSEYENFDWSAFIDHHKAFVENYNMTESINDDYSLPIIIGAYGTLRQGMHNSDFMKSCGGIYLGSRRLFGYALWQWGDSIIPYARPSDDKTESIVIDLFLIDTIEGLHSLDRLEGTPSHYTRVAVEGISIYVDSSTDQRRTSLQPWVPKNEQLQKIPNGDYTQWYIKFQREKLNEQLLNVALELKELNEQERSFNDLEWISTSDLAAYIFEINQQREDYAKTYLQNGEPEIDISDSSLYSKDDSEYDLVDQ